MAEQKGDEKKPGRRGRPEANNCFTIMQPRESPEDLRPRSASPILRALRRSFDSTSNLSIADSKSSLMSRTRTLLSDWDMASAEIRYDSTFKQPSASVVTEPPRPAREGFEWVWFPEGYWAERERIELRHIESRKKTFLRKKADPEPNGDSSSRSSSQHTIQSTVSRKTIPLHESNLTRPDDHGADTSPLLSHGGSSRKGTSQGRKKLFDPFLYISPTYPHFKSPTGEPEGLYCKTKRGIGERIIRKRKAVC